MKTLMVMTVLSLLSVAAIAKPTLNCVCSSYSPSTEADGKVSAVIHSSITGTEDALLTPDGVDAVTKYLGARDVSLLVVRKQIDAEQVRQLGAACKSSENESLFGCRLMIR